MKKRMLAILVCIALILSSVPLIVFANTDITSRAIEFKDIDSIALFRKNGDSIEEMKQCDVNDVSENAQNYLVRVDLVSEPSFYAQIGASRVEDGMLKFDLVTDFDVVGFSNGVQTDVLTVNYGTVTNGTASLNNFALLIQRMNANPRGTYYLCSNLDASSLITSSAAYVTSNFSGALIGNGYTIKNLSRPLFASLTAGSRVTDLVLSNVNLSGSAGALATVAGGTYIKNVHIRNINIKNAPQKTGSFIGQVNAGSVFYECSVANFNITTSSLRTGGIIGSANGVTIRNCYANGIINATGNYVGGICGTTENNTLIDKCISDVNFASSTVSNYNGGLIGHIFSKTTVNNSISLSNGINAYSLWDTKDSLTSTNCYELSDTNLISSNRNTVASNNVNADFYAETLGFDGTIWNLSSKPSLNNADPYSSARAHTENPNAYIPDLDILQSLSSYRTDREIAYANMYKLMPFCDSRTYVEDGNRVAADDIINTKLIKGIVALDNAGEMVTYISDNTTGKIKNILVLFDDGTTEEYSVSYTGSKGFIANYRVSGQNFDYSYDRYIIASDSQLATQLKQYAHSLTYTENLDPLTAAADSRLYKDTYEEITVEKLDEIVDMTLSQSRKFTYNIDSPILVQMIENGLLTNRGLDKIIYAFNYYIRWYSFKVNSVSAYAALLAGSDLFQSTMSFDNIIGAPFESNATLGTNASHNFYSNFLGKYTGVVNIGLFVEKLVSVFTDYNTADDWFTENFKGIIREVGIDDKPSIPYRAWTLMKVRSHLILPLLNVPADCTYLISCPTQIMIGAQRTYIKDPTDPVQKAELISKIETQANLEKKFYTTLSGLADNSRFNFVNIQYDNRSEYAGGNSRETQYPGTTKSGYHKYVIEAIGAWNDLNGSGAYADGTDVYWVCYYALSHFYCWSHETGHNQDGRLFLNGRGRRSGGAPEDYADGNTAQTFGDSSINFNLAYDFAMSSDVTTNFTAQRVDSPEKMHSYYKGMFETLDYLDYAEALAFLRLTPAQQAAVGAQCFYPNVDESRQETGDSTSGWRVLTEEDFAAMNLQTVEDLWDNHIIISPGLTGTSTLGTNKYGNPGIYTRHWYQTHNDNGRPDSNTMKQLPFEMAGIGGYYNGYIAYYSGANANDLAALRAIIAAVQPSWATVSANQYTWKQYKMDRYSFVQSIWDDMQYVDSDKLVEQYYNALVSDAEASDRRVTNATNVRRLYYHFFKRVTNDFVEDVFGQENLIHISTADQFVSLLNENPYGNYVLDNDIDLSGVTGGDTVIGTTFMGKLNGRGHALFGTDNYIFNSIKHAYIVDTVVSRTKRQTIAKTVTLSQQNNVIFETTKNQIYNAQDFAAMAQKPDESFILMNDIDFTGYTASDAVVGGTFTGTLIGNGYTIKNLNNASLFNQFNGSAYDFNVEGFTNLKPNADTVNAFAKQTNNADIHDITFRNINISGRYRAAVVCGVDNANSSFRNIKVFDSNVTGGNGGVYNAMLIGRKYGGTVENVYIDGTLRVSATENAGIIGCTHNGVVVKNVVSNIKLIMDANTDSSGRKLNGGIVGNAYGNITVRNSVFTGLVLGDTYSFTGSTNISEFGNCYEVTDNGGISVIDEEHIMSIAVDELTEEFYKNVLGFGDDFWPYERMTSTVADRLIDGYKAQKAEQINALHRSGENAAVAQAINNAKSEIEAYVYNTELTLSENKAAVDHIAALAEQRINDLSLEDHRIYNAQEFVSKLEADLSGTFYIMNDIDFSQVSAPSAAALVTRTFTGKIYGGYHTLRGLTNSALFAQFNGMATEMFIEDFTNNRPNTDFVCAFAKQTYGANISDIYFNNINLTGRHNTAVLSGMDGRDNANSVFTRISVTNSSVTANGYYDSLLCGRKYGGKVSDIYVEGTLTVSTTESGGVIGASHQGIVVTNVVSNVDIIMLRNTDGSGRKLNGGIVGNIYNSPAYSNCVYLGSVTGDTYSFTGTSAKNLFTNCYEINGSGGISAVNGQNIKSVEQTELTKSFYRSLGLDETVWTYSTIAQTGHPVLKKGNMPECAPVVASFENGATIEAGKFITLTCETENAVIYYTLDGSDPMDENNEARLVYTAPIKVVNADELVITAYAKCGSHHDSEDVQYTYSIIRRAENIVITNKNNTVKIGSTLQLETGFVPSDLSEAIVSWATSDDSVATVNDFGKVTGVAVGNAVITVTTINGLAAEYTVTVECEHVYDVDVEPATCTTHGRTITTCVICGECTITETELAEHDCEWTVTKEATCSEEGERHGVCRACGEEVTEVIAKTEHVFLVKTVDATCTVNGHTYLVCAVCGEKKTGVTIKAKGHVDKDKNGQCDECLKKLNSTTAKSHCDCNCHGNTLGNLFWRIVVVFYKMFRAEEYRVCECGALHW